MYLGQVSRYGTANQLARAMPKTSNIHMGMAKYLVSYLVGFVSVSITYERGGFKLAAYSDAAWGNNIDNGKLTSLYIVILDNGPISFKVGLRSLTMQFTIEAELVAAAFVMKEAVFCSNMMVKLDFERGFSSVPLYLDSASTLHVAGNCTHPLGQNALH